MSENNEHKVDVVEHTIEAFVKEVVRLTVDGFAISMTNPGDAVGYGNCYTVSMYRDDFTTQALKDKVAGMQDRPKMSRAESLAKAREARAAIRLDVDSIVE